MAKKKTVNATDEKKRTGRAINVWIDDALFAALQKYINSLRPRPTTTSVVEMALEDLLRAQHLWPSEAKE
jgi:hypothetical protein